MNIKTGLLGATITSAFLLMASCGGSDSNDGGGAGASSAGKASGGSSSTAGTTSNTAGTKTNTGGSSNNDGGTTSNNGGTRPGGGGFDFGGELNFGGAGFDPADYMCNPKPTVGAACAAGTQPCADGSTVCYCQQEKWACIDLSGLGEGGAGNGGPQPAMCPAAAPMNGDACSGFAACPYGQGKYCGCLGTMWMCN